MRYFKHKTSRFGSLLSLTIVCAMVLLLVLAFPTVWQSSAGRLFAVLWGLVAILVAGSHVRRLLVRDSKRPTYIVPVVLKGGNRHKQAQPRAKMMVRNR